jgi:hypothetical protein
MSDPNRDSFAEEEDLQAWATEMGGEYVLGTQGRIQPMREMSDDTLLARTDMAEAELREISGLPAVMDEEEKALHRTEAELELMSEEQLIEWNMDVAEWLGAHPNATFDNLINPDPDVE